MNYFDVIGLRCPAFAHHVANQRAAFIKQRLNAAAEYRLGLRHIGFREYATANVV